MQLAKNTTITLNKSTKPLENASAILKRDMQILDESETPGEIAVHIPEREDPLDESYSIEATETKIIITAASSLGGVFGLLRVSGEFLGVESFWFWNDRPPKKLGTVSVPPGTYNSEQYRVRFRGWYFNDEVLLETWRPVPEDPDFGWRMGMEALLRCGGNMAIPGTDHNSRKNRQLAADMGLWITHHHTEALGAQMFARAYPELAPSFKEHPDLFIKLWREGIASQEDCNVVWVLGFRGQGDRPFWEDDPEFDTPKKRGRMISDIIRLQYELVREAHKNPVCCTNLYGEILELYNQGCLDLPNGVICVWGDSGYGKMVSRRQLNHNPRIPALPDKPGAHGVYYHASFYDLQASGHIAMLPNPPSLIREEIAKAFAAGADKYLIVNCGNILPHVHVLNLLAALWAGRTAETNELFERFGESTIQYGPHADEKAGEQFYHHPARELAAAWIQGKSRVESLNWLCEGGFDDQLARFEALLEQGLPALNSYAESCSQIGGQLWLQSRIHTFGAESALWFCRAYRAFVAGDIPRAFCLAFKAKQSYARSLDDFSVIEKGVWRGFYENECLTDIRLTVTFMEILMAWLRMLGEGADRQLWHRLYIMDESDKGVMLVTNFYRPFSDDELAKGML